MGKFKDEGNPAIALMEEMAEAIQVIAKLNRFNGSWDEIPPGKDKTRWDELYSEMMDVFYQWHRLLEERTSHSEPSDGSYNIYVVGRKPR